MSKKSLELLRELNGDRLRHLVGEEYDVIAVGRTVKDTKTGESNKLRFDWDTLKGKGGLKAKNAGVESSKYLRCMFKKAGSFSESLIDNTEQVYQGSKKAQAHNVFQNVQPEIYDFILGQLKKGNYTEVGKTADGLTRVRVHGKVAGSVASITVPRYKIQTRDAAGNRTTLKSRAVYDPKSDSYIPNQDATSMTFRFFVDIDDINNGEVEAIAVRHYERNVMHFEVAEKKVVTKQGKKKTIELLEEQLTDEEDLPPDDDVLDEEEEETEEEEIEEEEEEDNE